jgi:hypothetical protein
MFHEGDIVEIPLPDGETAIGWILHISTRFKGAVGFVVLGMKGQLREDYDAQKHSLKVLGPLYTNIKAIHHYGWKTIQHQPVSESKRLLTRREVGGGVYVGDEYMGSAKELGDTNLRPMIGMGMPGVYREIKNAFGKQINETDSTSN